MTALDFYVYITEYECDGGIFNSIKTVHVASPAPSNIVHKCEVISVGDLSTLKMKCGENNKPLKIIHLGQLKEYIGIGWITEREATVTDYYNYPVAM